MEQIIKEITMYVFTDPQPNKEDLFEWKEHFAQQRPSIYSKICSTDKGYVLLVEGLGRAVPPEKPYYEADMDAPRGPCIYCGGTSHIEEYNQHNPHFKYCCDLCQEMDKGNR